MSKSLNYICKPLLILPMNMTAYVILIQNKELLTTSCTLYALMSQVRPGSNAVLHMSRTQFNQSGSGEVRRLTQFSTTDFIWSG